MLLRLAVILLLQLGPSLAAARSEGKVLAYPKDHAWATAVRFVAVDERAKVLDKDADAGYVLFEFLDDGKPYRGSLELVALKSDTNATVRFVISLPDRPSWMEVGMLGRLEAKLRAELGPPVPPKPKPPKDPDKDKDGTKPDKPDKPE